VPPTAQTLKTCWKFTLNWVENFPVNAVTVAPSTTLPDTAKLSIELVPVVFDRLKGDKPNGFAAVTKLAKFGVHV